MSTLKINKGLLLSTIDLPRSKSFANRALILAAISETPKTILNLPNSSDVASLVIALEMIGLDIKQENHSTTILNSFPLCEKQAVQVIPVGEGGTTARFIAALLLKGRNKYQLKLQGRLKDRPWNDFLNFARDHGGHASLDGDILTIQGPVSLPSQVYIDCSLTTQFATAIKLSFSGITQIEPRNLKTSKSYWNLTEMMVKQAENTDPLVVPLDWSSASYPLAFGALNQEIKFPGLVYDPYQSDAKFFNILEKIGAIEELEDGLLVKQVQVEESFCIDVSDSLDLVPALVFFLSHIEGEHELKGIKNLVYKESDRLKGIIELLSSFNRSTEIREDSLFISGKTTKISKNVSLQLDHDHRMVMAGTLFLLHHGGGNISPTEAVEKSYPSFYKILDIRYLAFHLP